MTFEEITAERRRLAREHNLKLVIPPNGGNGYMVGPEPYASEYNRLAAVHGIAQRIATRRGEL